jgi:hypothetical protein
MAFAASRATRLSAPAADGPSQQPATARNLGERLQANAQTLQDAQPMQPMSTLARLLELLSMMPTRREATKHLREIARAQKDVMEAIMTRGPPHEPEVYELVDIAHRATQRLLQLIDAQSARIMAVAKQAQQQPSPVRMQGQGELPVTIAQHAHEHLSQLVADLRAIALRQQEEIAPAHDRRWQRQIARQHAIRVSCIKTGLQRGAENDL